MKRILLFTLGSISFLTVHAQETFTQANHYLDDMANYFVCKSDTATFQTLSEITGNGVTWNYGTIDKLKDSVPSVHDSLATVYIKDSLDTIPNMNLFAGFGSFTQEYLTTSADSLEAQRMTIADPTLGLIKARFASSPIFVPYPFSFGETQESIISGDADAVTLNQFNKPLSGTHVTKYDGYGTLKLNATTINYVSRLSLTDTLNVDTQDPGVGIVPVILEVLEYYNLGLSSSPIFVVKKLTVSIPGLSTYKSLNVISKYDPTVSQTLSTKSISKINFEISPNPANDKLTINGDFNKAVITLIDETGKIVLKGEFANNEVIKIDNLKSGVYIVKAIIDNQVITKKIVKE